jgi:hypothetical protein
MPDGFSITIDDRALLAALDRLGPAVEKYTMPAAKVTANNIQREAQRRVARRTGATAKGIEVREDYTRTGYVVVTSDVLSSEEHARRQGYKTAKLRNATYANIPHVGLYLEEGTIRGEPGSHTSAARPFLFPAAELERGSFERRIREAIQQAIDDEGFGG